MCQHVCDFVFMYVHILVTLAAGVCTYVSGGWACICVPVCWCNDCNMNFRIIHHVSLKTPRGARNKTIYTDETPRTPSPHLHFNLMWTVGNYLHCQRTPRMLFSSPPFRVKHSRTEQICGRDSICSVRNLSSTHCRTNCSIDAEWRTRTMAASIAANKSWVKYSTNPPEKQHLSKDSMLNWTSLCL